MRKLNINMYKDLDVKVYFSNRDKLDQMPVICFVPDEEKSIIDEIIFLVDESASMNTHAYGGNSKVYWAKELVIKSIINYYQDELSYSYMVSNSNEKLMDKFSRINALTWISSRKFSGWWNVDEGMENIHNISINPNAAIIIITDGQECVDSSWLPNLQFYKYYFFVNFVDSRVCEISYMNIKENFEHDSTLSSSKFDYRFISTESDTLNFIQTFIANSSQKHFIQVSSGLPNKWYEIKNHIYPESQFIKTDENGNFSEEDLESLPQNIDFQIGFQDTYQVIQRCLNYEFPNIPISDQPEDRDPIPDNLPSINFHDNQFVHFSNNILGGEYIFGQVNIIGRVSDWCKKLGQGNYPNIKDTLNNISMLNGMAITKDVRVIVYSEPNFGGNIMMDVIGPAVLNNDVYNRHMFPPFHTNYPTNEWDIKYPPEKREWIYNMDMWRLGSIKIIFTSNLFSSHVYYLDLSTSTSIPTTTLAPTTSITTTVTSTINPPTSIICNSNYAEGGIYFGVDISSSMDTSDVTINGNQNTRRNLVQKILLDFSLTTGFNIDGASVSDFIKLIVSCITTYGPTFNKPYMTIIFFNDSSDGMGLEYYWWPRVTSFMQSYSFKLKLYVIRICGHDKLNDTNYTMTEMYFNNFFSLKPSYVEVAEFHSYSEYVTNGSYPMNDVLNNSLQTNEYTCTCPNGSIINVVANSVDEAKLIAENDCVLPPTTTCFCHMSDYLIGGSVISGASVKIFESSLYCDIVGAGNYPDASIAFPNAASGTFDGMVVGPDVERIIIYSEKNYAGSVLLDVAGPMVVNNTAWISQPLYLSIHTEDYPPELQAIYPQSRRVLSASNMNTWKNGSLKIICNSINQQSSEFDCCVITSEVWLSRTDPFPNNVASNYVGIDEPNYDLKFIGNIFPKKVKVNPGFYPIVKDNLAFSNASTLDGIAIGAKTRFIAYERPNFQGRILIDVSGPLIINSPDLLVPISSIGQDLKTHPYSTNLNVNQIFTDDKITLADFSLKNIVNGSVKILCGDNLDNISQDICHNPDNIIAHFSDDVIGLSVFPTQPFQPHYHDFCRLLPPGDYPDAYNTFVYRNGATLDGAVIKSGIRLIVYKDKNFQGEILGDYIGPKVINNKYWIDYYTSSGALHYDTSNEFPLSSFTDNDNMNQWQFGSFQLICLPQQQITKVTTNYFVTQVDHIDLNKNITISLWVNWTTLSSFDILFLNSHKNWRNINHNATLNIYYNELTSTFSCWNNERGELSSQINNFTPILNTWYHIGIIKYNKSLLLSIDGKIINVINCDNIVFDTNDYYMQINGGTKSIDNKLFHGYISDLEILSYAKWTADFVVPQNKSIVTDQTKFLLHIDEEIIDKSSNTFVSTNTIYTSTQQTKFNEPSLYFPGNNNVEINIQSSQTSILNTDCFCQMSSRIIGLEKIFINSSTCDIVGSGDYSNIELIFNNANQTNINSLVIGKNTRIIIYNELDYSGNIVLNRKGPLVINNTNFRKTSNESYHLNNYDPDLQIKYPQYIREWSSFNLNTLRNKSIKVIYEPGSITNLDYVVCFCNIRTNTYSGLFIHNWKYDLSRWNQIGYQIHKMMCIDINIDNFENKIMDSPIPIHKHNIHTLTATNIYDILVNKYGPISSDSRIVFFIEDTDEMNRETILHILTEFYSLYENNHIIVEYLYNNKFWLQTICDAIEGK